MNKVCFALIFCLIGISESCFSSYSRAMDRLNCPEKHDVWLSGKKTGETSSGPNSAVSSSTTGSSTHLGHPPPKSRSKQKLLQTESSDFKLVFISSDSSKDSDQLNSSLENSNENGGEMSGEMEFDFPPKIPPKVKNLNLISPGDFSEKMSISTSDGTSIRTAATRDRHSPLLRSPRIQKVRNIPVTKAPSMDDRSITEMSIHDMQMMMSHHNPPMDSSVLSRSLSESDLSEIIGGATGSDPPSPIHMMAPSDEDENHTGRSSSHRQGHLRSSGPSHGSGQGYHRRALPPAPVLPQSLRSVAPPIYYNSSGNSSTSSELDPYVKRSLSSVNPKNRPAPIAKPVRRSKSQRNFVTSIQHGGSVTLVSLNGDSMNGQKDQSEVKHVHHHHFVPPFTDGQSINGSQTLPRKGSKKISLKPSAADDSEVVIKKQGLNGVKIQLNLNHLEEIESDEVPELSTSTEKRKYTLEELEVEGFSSASNSGKNSDYDEEVDLNSLIEGDVDEIDEDSQTLGDIIPDVDNIELKTTDSEESEEKMDLRSDPTHSTTSSSITAGRRLVIRTEDSDENESNDDFDSFSDLEPELVQLQNRNNNQQRFSDTEADFLDSQSQSTTATGCLDRKMSELSNLDSSNNSSAGLQSTRAQPNASSAACAPPQAETTLTQPKKEVSSEQNSVEEKRENFDQPKVQSDLNKSKKKSSVSQLIARFEGSPAEKEPLRVTRSVTPEKILRDKSPYRPKSAVEIEPIEEKNHEELPLGAEALSEEANEDLDQETEDEMTRRNGAYTSYVLIGASAGNDVETASIHSGRSAGSGGSGGRVVVNVNKGVVLQDGRASNISIVSTESSELGSPNEDSLLEPVPDIPAKIRARNGQVLDPGPDMQYFVAQTSSRPADLVERSRGGEDTDEYDESLTNYYANGIGEPNPSGSRRGRPPVIRAADRSMRRGQMYHEEIGEGEIMVEYDDEFRITEVGPNGEQYEIYTDEMLDEDEVYDVRYESEEGEEEYVDNSDYPMCQPIQYDSEEYISEGDEYFDREEELRGYNRQIDFTLHTILEESCEDSDNSEPKSRPVEQKKSKRHSDPSEMEKYFLYGVGGHDDNEEYYTTSEGSSSPDEILEDDLEGVEPTSMISERQAITDDSGSVGSESDGQPTPNMTKKKVVTNKRGSTRFSSDNGSGSESESESSANSSKVKAGFKSKRRGSASDIEMKTTQSPNTSLSPKNSPPITPLPSQIIEVQPINSEDQVIRKHKSRDSGFVGSMDDLLRNENGSKSDSSNERQSLEKVSEVSENEESQQNGSKQVEIKRKDSFNTNWSSDEDTNIMMNRMRAFFRSFLASKVEKPSESKPLQIQAFEAKLTKMMKTVPGINEQQVKEIVEYLSSEDTWSDSYDSSDYTSSDIDLEVYGINVNTISDEDIIEDSDFQKETALMYSKLMAKMQENKQEKPAIAAQVMAHISSKLVALMHEESMEEPSDPKEPSKPISGPPSRRYKPTNKSKSVEVLDENQVDVWQGASRQEIASSTHGVHLSSISSPRRGSLGQVSGSSNGQVSDLLNDDERWSWKGSFESALALPGNKSMNQPETNQTTPTQKVTSARFKPSMVVDHAEKNYSTGSLPRLGTSSIKKAPQTIETSEATLELSVPKKPVNPTNIATNINSGPPRSARYRPHGYRPPPSTSRKASPSSRKSSVDNSKYTDDAASDFSSKSGSPSPILGGPRLPHGVVASRDLVRDFRESSVHSRSSHGDHEESPFREESIPRSDYGEERQSSQRHPSPFNRASNSSLGSRSESMASVYSADGGRFGTVNVKGDVEFGLVYNLHTGSLELAIKQCKDLAAVDTKRNRSDPYVKVYLLPDKSKSGKRKTKVKKHTLNPVFDEMLKFQMPLEEVERRTLWVTVWHSDMFGRNDFLGEVMLPINTIPLDDPQPRWYSLQDRTEPLSEELAVNGTSYRGEIIVALKFLPPNSSSHSSKKLGRRSSNSKGTLLILVKEAKNLVSPKGTNIPDPFCKGYLLPERGKGGKQKTGVCRKTVCPKWEHTMAWDDISLEALWDRSLELTVWDHDRLGHNEILGGVRFNLGKGASIQGRSQIWMDANGGEVTLWQQMLERPNFWVEGSVPLRTSDKLQGGSA